MARRIAIIQGHPDSHDEHFGHALANSYAMGAGEAGHKIRRIEVAEIEFPLLRSEREWTEGPIPAAIQEGQATITWADHLVFFYPLWLGTMPALLKAFLEQVFRPGFALDTATSKGMPKKLLKQKSARIVVTMGMPATIYRWYYRAHSVKNFERNMLKFCGINPVEKSYIGLVGDKRKRQDWLDTMHKLGADCA